MGQVTSIQPVPPPLSGGPSTLNVQRQTARGPTHVALQGHDLPPAGRDRVHGQGLVRQTDDDGTHGVSAGEHAPTGEAAEVEGVPGSAGVRILSLL